jgi:HMG (high mobility group) box
MAKYTGPMHVPNKRTKKPQGAPKRAISSFLSFSQLMRPEIRAQYPNLKNTDVSSVLAQRWHEASEEEKRPHIERELRDREKYHEEMAAWKESEAQCASDEARQAALADTPKGSSTLGYLNQHPSSSLWAAMIDVNGTSAFDTSPSVPPLYDEAMVGFWDTEMEGGDNQFGCSASSEKSSEKDDKNSDKGDKNFAPTRFASTSGGAATFHPGSSSQKAVKRETPLTSAKKSKEERLAKRTKAQKAGSSHADTNYPGSNQPNLPLTAQQLEIQQRRLQQQHQYQMYQQHLLNQKQRGEKAKVANQEPTNQLKQPRDIRPAPRALSSAGSIMEGGRLHTQAKAMQRLQSGEDYQYQQQKQVSYQGTQRGHNQQAPMPWPFGLPGFAGALDQQTLASMPSAALRGNGPYSPPPLAAYSVDPYYAQPYGQMHYPASSYGYGLIDGIERYFFDAPSAPQAQAQAQIPVGPETNTFHPSHSQEWTERDPSVEPSVAPEASSSVQSFNVDNNNNTSGKTSSSETSNSQSMRSFQFDEQDKFCVMQTLMAVHRASASKAGDSETLLSLDRIQMVQGQGSGQAHDGQSRQGQGLGPPLSGRYLDLNDSAGKAYVASEGRAKTSSTANEGAINLEKGQDDGRGGYCAPLSVQQQERQNQAERQQLKDRQLKQMQEMLQLQEREQAEQFQEHSSSMVSASGDRMSTHTVRPKGFEFTVARKQNRRSYDSSSRYSKTSESEEDSADI